MSFGGETFIAMGNIVEECIADARNIIYLLFATVWLSGLIWASVIAFKNRRKK